jgi:DnaJ domain
VSGARIRTREWSSTDYYGVLGVDAATPAAEIDNRYRELAKSLHPDRNADPADQERFKQVSAAYSALKDPATRHAYDEFRTRVAEGRLYGAAPVPTPTPGPARVDHLAPPRRPRTRRPMPGWLRATLATLMMALGVLGLGWALFGELPSPAHADTPVAVQVTLVIMALKFLACGVAVGWYPQLRARWHH